MSYNTLLVPRQIAGTTNFDDTIDFLFPPLEVLEDIKTCLHRAFLSPPNAYVDKFNHKILDKLPGNFRKYRKRISIPHATHEI
ncbi:hypothetical protein BD769DRAFT_1401191, partial [Suillus cothurnatus]